MDVDNKKINLDDIIIERPQRLRKTRHFSEMGLAAIGWIVWIFIVRPIFLALLWLMGFKIFYEEVIKNESLKNFQQLWIYLIIIILLYTVLQLWNRYNVLRFRGKERRMSSSFASESEVGAFYEMTEEDVKNLKGWKMVNVHFSSDNQIIFEDALGNDSTQICGHYNPKNKI